jgi:hypothetical protein
MHLFHQRDQARKQPDVSCDEPEWEFGRPFAHEQNIKSDRHDSGPRVKLTSLPKGSSLVKHDAMAKLMAAQ